MLLREEPLSPDGCELNLKPAMVDVRLVLAEVGYSAGPMRTDGLLCYGLKDVRPGQKTELQKADRIGRRCIRVMRTRRPRNMNRMLRILQCAQELDSESPTVNRFEHHMLLADGSRDPQRLLRVSRASAQRQRALQKHLDILRRALEDPAWQRHTEIVRARILECEEEYADLIALAASTDTCVTQESNASRSHCEFQDLASWVLLVRRQPEHLRAAMIKLLPEMQAFARLCGSLAEDVMAFAFAGGKKFVDRVDARSMATALVLSYLINDLPWDRVGNGEALRSYVRKACGVKLYVRCVADALGLDSDAVALVFRKWRYEEKTPNGDPASLRGALGLAGPEYARLYDKMLSAEATMRAEPISIAVLIERNADGDGADEPRPPTHGEDVAVDNRTIEECRVQALLERTPVETLDAFHRWAPLAADARTRKKRVSTRRLRKTLGIDSKQWGELMGFVRELNGLVRDDDFDPEDLTRVG
jgi:hypothetical protein